MKLFCLQPAIDSLNRRKATRGIPVPCHHCISGFILFREDQVEGRCGR